MTKTLKKNKEGAIPFNFICPTCGREMSRDLLVIVPHTETHIIDVIKKKHLDWVETDGICKKCYEYLKQQLHPK